MVNIFSVERTSQESRGFSHERFNTKYQGDAFTNPDLVDHIKNNRITEVGIVGVDGGGCVALTAMGAIKQGLKVTLHQEAIGTTFVKKKEKYYKKLKKLGAKLT